MLPNGIRQNAWNRIDMLGELIAAEAPASAPHLRRWVGIYSASNREMILSRIPSSLPYKYNVYEFELLKDKLSEYEGDEDLIITSSSRHYINSIPELDALLSELGVDPKLFDAPWHVDYPY